MANTNAGNIFTVKDVALNDSDKTIALINAERIIVQEVFVKLISTATAGNRRISIEVLDHDDNVLAIAKSLATQAANLTRYYSFTTNNTGAGTFVNDHLPSFFPEMVLFSGCKVRVFDETAVDATHDDMTVVISGMVG